VADLSLPRPPTLSPAAGLALAQLDDQLRRLHDFLEGWEVEHLEWQARKGRNTAGMLLTHMAIVELGWMHMASGGSAEAREARILAQLGMSPDADGIPLKRGGLHPENLAGRTAEEYLAKIDRTRDETRAIAAGWTDEDLAGSFAAGGHTFTREWVLYHLLEHFAAHFGQIAALARAMRGTKKGGPPFRET
jgi:uncharacterized damage-inducible protein DinB